jgi:hypothetical protein
MESKCWFLEFHSAHKVFYNYNQFCCGIIQRKNGKTALIDEAEKIKTRSNEIKWSRTSVGITEEADKTGSFYFLIKISA